MEHGEIEGVVRRPDVSGKDPIPVAEISSRHKALPLEDMHGRVRRAALRNNRGLFTNADTGWKISLTRQGVKKAVLYARDDGHVDVEISRKKIEIVAVLPELLKNAVRYESEPNLKDRKPEIIAFHHFVAAVRLDGQLERVRLTVAEEKFGRRFYDHYTLEKDGPHSLKNVVQERALKAIAAVLMPAVV